MRNRGIRGVQVFTVPQLARLAGIAPHTMRLMLRERNVPIRKISANRTIVLRTSLELYDPELVDTLRFANDED